MSQRRVVLIVTGGIAGYKACEVVRLLGDREVAVDVVMTPAATQFVTPMTFEALSGRRVWTELLPGCTDGVIDHIALGRAADAVVIAPASADFLASAVAGRAHDLALALLLALPKGVPVLLCPAMNQEMWSHPATRRNVAAWTAFEGVDYRVLDPVVKELACGEYGPGGLAEPQAICDATWALWNGE